MAASEKNRKIPKLNSAIRAPIVAPCPLRRGKGCSRRYRPMDQTRLAGSRTKRPTGGSTTASIPVRKAQGAAGRKNSFHAIPVPRGRRAYGGVGGGGVPVGKSAP